jgi:hypothetical protein
MWTHAEAMLVALGPLEVVHQRPVKVALDRHTVADGPVQFAQVARKKIDAGFVVHVAVDRDPVVAGEPILGDDDRELYRSWRNRGPQ